VSQIWEVFINNCKQRYYPGENITIDEQLLALEADVVFGCMYRTNRQSMA